MSKFAKVRLLGTAALLVSYPSLAAAGQVSPGQAPQPVASDGPEAAPMPALSRADAAIGTSADNGTEATAAEIVVTGSRISSAEAAESRALPIDVIGQEQFARSGATDLGRLLLKNPDFAGSAAFQGDNAGNSYVGQTNLNLRGLGVQYTLTLVNGRRISADGPGNSGLLPKQAIDRIEIFKSGASAIYGSDAVSGVVNLVPKTSFEGFAIDGLYGDVTSGSINDRNIGFQAGAKLPNLKLYVAGNYQRSNILPASARRVTRFNDQRTLGGTDDRSSATSPAYIGDVPGTNGPVILDTSRFRPGQYSTSPAEYRPFDFEIDGAERPGRSALSSSRIVNVYGSVEYDIDPNKAILLLNGTYFSARTTSYAGSALTFFFGDGQLDPVPASNPYNPFGVDLYDVRYRGAERGAGGIYWRTEERDAELSLRGRLGSFKYSVGALYHQTDLPRVSDGKTIYGVNSAINRSGTDALNPFCYNCNTDAQLAGVLIRYRRGNSSTLKSAHADGSIDLFETAGGRVTVAFGADYRTEANRTYADPDLLNGQIYGEAPYVLQRLRRSIRSLYGELRLPLTSRDFVLGEFELQGALRNEHYSDVGTTTNPLIAFTWKPWPWVIARSSYSTAFRAPALTSLDSVTAHNEYVLTDPLTKDPVAVDVISGGNPNLKPETAKLYSAGLIVSPPIISRLRLSADYFQVKQAGVVASVDPQLVLNGSAPGTVVRGDRIGQVAQDIVVYALLQNIGVRQVEGIDFNVQYSGKLAASTTASVELGATRLLTYKVDSGLDDALVSVLGQYSTTFNTGLPRWRGQATFNLTHDKLGSFSLTEAYVGRYRDDPNYAEDPANPRHIPSRFTTDVQISTRLYGENSWTGLTRGPNVDWAIGVQNLFNTLPPFVRATNSYDAGLHDLRGRFIYTSLSAHFR